MVAARAATRLLDASVLARFGVLQGTDALLPSGSVLSLGWPELERVLPDRGLPRGVVELASPVARRPSAGGFAKGGATTIALRAVSAVHHADRDAWCAWVVPARAPSLYAPAAMQAGVDLDRLLVVRPEPAALARTVVKVAASGAFDVVVVDAHAGLGGVVEGAALPRPGATRRSAPKAKVDGAVVVRKLALASEEKGTTFLLLTNAYAARPVPWPVALRLEVERRPEAIALRVTKDRRGATHDAARAGHAGHAGDADLATAALRSSTQHVVRVAC
jgi:recombination protein RecA